MTNYKTRCGYLGCHPTEGQCLGFCESMPIQFAGPEPLESDFEFPDQEEEKTEDAPGIMRWALSSLAAILLLGIIVFI